MAAVEWPSHATWNPQPSRMQLDDGEDEDSQDSDGGETPERSHRTSASARSQRVRTTSASTHSGVACQVNGCKADLSVLKHYHQRYKVCEFHLKQTQVEQDGILQRFCQQCSRFHELAEFDGTRRSCRMRLQRHNARRRKKAAERPSSKKMALGKGRLSAAGFQHQPPALSVPKQSQRLAAKAARAGGGAQRSESDADDSGQALGGVPNNSGGANGRHGGLLPSLPDPSAWPFAAALRGDSIADGDERHLQELMAGAGWRPGAPGHDGLLPPTSPGGMQPQLSIPYLMQHARLCARGLSPELDPLGPALQGFAGGGIGGIGGLGRLGTPLPAVLSAAASGHHGVNGGVGGSYAGDTALRAFLGQPGSLGGQAAPQHRGSVPGGANGFAGHAASNGGGGGSAQSIFGNESAAKEAARLYDAAMQQQSLDAFLNPGWHGGAANGGGHSGVNGGLSQASGGPMQGSTQNSYRRQSGNDGAYRVLEKLAQRRSVNLGDPSALGGLLDGGGHPMAPPLMVHRTGSAPPAPGSSQLQGPGAAAPVRSRLSMQSPHEVMARAMMLTAAQPMDGGDGGGLSAEELRAAGLGADPLGPRRASESAAHTQQWLPNPGYHHHSGQQLQQQQQQHSQQHSQQQSHQQSQQHGHGMPPSFGTGSAGMLSGSVTNGAVNPFQRSAQMAAAATAGITQSALQEANALLDLRVQGNPSGAGGATLSAGSRFSPQPPQAGSGGNHQSDPMVSPVAAVDRASAQQQHHLPTCLLSGHNSGNTFSGVPHGFRVEAGGDTAALLCNGGGIVNTNDAAASGTDLGGGGTPTVKTTSRGSTGGDMGPPPPSATVRTSSDNHSQVLLSASHTPVTHASPPLEHGVADSDRSAAAASQPRSLNGDSLHAAGAEPPQHDSYAQKYESDLMPAPASAQLYG